MEAFIFGCGVGAIVCIGITYLYNWRDELRARKNQDARLLRHITDRLVALEGKSLNNVDQYDLMPLRNRVTDLESAVQKLLRPRR